MPDDIKPTNVEPVPPVATPPTPPAPPEEVKFENLAPEVQRFVDQERLKASTTAREKAKRDALTNPEIRAAISAELEREATLTAEQKVEQKMQEALLIKNRALAREKLVDKGFTGDQLNEVLEFVASSDEGATMDKVEKIVGLVGAMVEAEKDKMTRTALANTPKPSNTPTITTPFKDMSFEERQKLRDADPSRYKAEMEKLRSKI